MKVTDVHKNLHLTLTALQFAFSLHSVSVSYLCYILWYKLHYGCSHCAQPTRNQWNTNCKWPHITPPTHRGRLNDNLETVACGAKAASACVTVAGMAHWMCWWQSKALAAVIACATHHVESRHIPSYVIASGLLSWLVSSLAVTG